MREFHLSDFQADRTRRAVGMRTLDTVAGGRPRHRTVWTAVTRVPPWWRWQKRQLSSSVTKSASWLQLASLGVWCTEWKQMLWSSCFRWTMTSRTVRREIPRTVYKIFLYNPICSAIIMPLDNQAERCRDIIFLLCIGHNICQFWCCFSSFSSSSSGCLIVMKRSNDNLPSFVKYGN